MIKEGCGAVECLLLERAVEQSAGSDAQTVACPTAARHRALILTRQTRWKSQAKYTAQSICSASDIGSSQLRKEEICRRIFGQR